MLRLQFTLPQACQQPGLPRSNRQVGGLCHQWAGHGAQPALVMSTGSGVKAWCTGSAILGVCLGAWEPLVWDPGCDCVWVCGATWDSPGKWVCVKSVRQ